MIAIEIAAPGGPEMLKAVERPIPSIRDGDVLVRVEAAGVNRPDVMQRLGKYPPPPGASDIPGLEVAGTVAAVGKEVARWLVGDRVCALVSGGGYAEFCAVPALQCLPIPEGITTTAAAAIPETFFTVWINLFQRGGLRSGEQVLIHGGTSGIGTTAIQMARALGATVFATAGSRVKCEACVRLGATVAIDYRSEDFAAVIRDRTAGRGVEVILDIIGGEYLQKNLDSLALNGRLVQIGLIGGARTQINLTPILQRRLTLTGSTLRARTAEEKGAIAAEVEARVWPLIESGAVAPVIDRVFPLTAAADAHRAIEAGTHIGKIVLAVS